MSAPGALVTLDDGGLSLRWEKLATWRSLTVRCRLEDGGESTSAGWSSATGTEGSYRTECGPLQAELDVGREDGACALRLLVTPSRPVEVTELAITGRLEVAGEAPRWLLYNGYQSWDRSGCSAIECATSARDPARGESWWTIAITDDGGSGLAGVAKGSSSAATRFTVDHTELGVVWCEPPGPVPASLVSDGRWASPVVVMGAGSDARRRLGSLAGGRQASRPPVGWLSWYHFGPFVGRDEILEHSELLADGPFHSLGYRLVQLDDGWQQAYGEWLPNAKFPGGLAALAEETNRRGQCFGVWTAPFLVSASADLADQAPTDWFVIDPATNERLVDTRHQIFGPMYVLDAAQPGVQAYLRELFGEMYSVGVRYFKIDFLYAGGYAGNEALAAGLRAIRDGAHDAYVLASGAPLLPVLGLVDGCRVGPDTATPLIDFETGGPRPTVLADEVMDVGRNLAARFFLDGWFQLDADVALVGGNLTLDQGRQLVTLAALAGGPFLASDDLPRLPPERLELLTNPEVLGLVGHGPAVPDWEPNADDMPPTHWRLGDVLAVFNWTNQHRQIRIRAAEADGARDLWARAELPDLRDGAEIEVPANGVRLLRLDRG